MFESTHGVLHYLAPPIGLITQQMNMYCMYMLSSVHAGTHSHIVFLPNGGPTEDSRLKYMCLHDMNLCLNLALIS